MAEEGQRLFGGVLPLDDVGSGDIDLAGRFAEFLQRLHAIVDAFAESDAARRLGGGDRRGRRQPDGRPRPGGVAARPARPPARGGRRRGHDRRRGHADGAGAARDPRAARRPAAWPADAGELPHRAPHDLHARPDAVGAASRRLPDGTRRRRLPPADGARRGRPAAPRSARRRSRRPQRGPPAAARRGAGRDRPPGDHVRRPGTSGRTCGGRRPSPSASCSTSSIAPRGSPTRRRRASGWSSSTRCSRSTCATSTQARWCPSGRGASTGSRCDGARALAGGQVGAPPFLAGPLPPEQESVIELDQLVRFVQHPVRAFLRRRLGVGGSRARRRRGGRAVDRARRARAVERRGAAARGPARGCRQRRRDRGRDRPRGAAAGPAGGVGARGRLSGRRAARRGGGGLRPGRRGERLRRREGGATGRSHAGRDGARRPRRPRRRLDVLAGRAEASADRVGVPARARRRAPGDGLRGGHARPAPGGRAAGAAR